MSGKPMTRKTPFWTGIAMTTLGAVGSTRYPESPLTAMLVLGIVMVVSVGIYVFIDWLSDS